jgi:hypothetical protein
MDGRLTLRFKPIFSKTALKRNYASRCTLVRITLFPLENKALLGAVCFKAVFRKTGLKQKNPPLLAGSFAT